MVLVLSGTSQTCAVPVSGFLVGLNKSSLVFPTLPEFQLEETPVLSSSLKLQISRKAQKTQLFFSILVSTSCAPIVELGVTRAPPRKYLFTVHVSKFSYFPLTSF